MDILLCVVAFIVGLFISAYGLLRMSDPEGRGSNFWPLIPVGMLVSLCGLIGAVAFIVF